MTVLFVEPHKRPVTKEISSSLESLQQLVGGYIQAIFPFEEDGTVSLVCHDEGKLLGLPMNRYLPEIGDIICGPFLVVGAPPDSENFASLTEEQLQRYQNRFRNPELFLKVGGSLMILSDREGW